MERILIRLLLFGVLSFFAGTAGLLYYFSKHESWTINMISYNKQQVIDANAVSAIDIDADTADVAFTVSNLDKISVRLVGEIKEDMQKDLRFDTYTGQFGTLGVKVDVPEDFGFTFGPTGSLQLQVIVPQKLYEQVRIKTLTGDVHTSRLEAAAYSFQSVTGDLELEGFTGKDLHIDTETGDITARAIEAKVNASSQTGEVELQFAKLTDDVLLDTETGDIELRLDNQPAAVQLDIQSDTGEIRAELSNLHIEAKDEHRLIGSIGDGGPRVHAKSSTGDIELR